MTRALFRTIVGRKGSFLGTAGVTLAAVVVVAVVLVIVHGLRPGRNPSIGGQPMLDGVSAAIWLLGGVGAIVIGALAGSYDVAQGTMRYLVLTGVRRIGMYAARTIALDRCGPARAPAGTRPRAGPRVRPAERARGPRQRKRGR